MTPPKRSIISPVSDDDEMRKRIQLSPSPEVDLSSPEFDDCAPPSPIDSTTGYHGGSGIFPRDRTASPIERKGALSSTPMEGDEQEFTQSAIQLKQRSVSREYEEQIRQKRAREQEEQEGQKHEEGKESEDAAALLGYAEPPLDGSLNSFNNVDASIISDYARIKREQGVDEAGKQQEDHAMTNQSPHADVAHFGSWAGDLQSPESIELDELDDLLGAGFE